MMKHLRTVLILTFISLFAFSCTDGERMRRQLACLQARNQTDSLLTNDSLAQALCDYFDSHGISNEQVLAHYLLARTYTDKGEAPRALDEYHRAAECADTTSEDCDYLLLAKVHGQMAELLYHNQLPRNSLNAFQQAYRYSIMADEPEVALNAYAQQGKCYYDLSLTDSAMFITEEAIRMLLECGDTLSANSFKGPVAYGLIEKGELSKAKEYIDSYEHHSFVTEELSDTRLSWTLSIVEHLKKKGTKGLTATEQELQDLRRLFTIYHPGFVESLHSTGYTLSIKEINICLLIKLNFAPSEICALLKVGNSALSNQRSRLLKKMFGTEGSATLFDNKIKNLNFEIDL